MTGAQLDTSALSGLSYSCRPDCGLCCYAEPLVTPSEKAGLLRIDPEIEFAARGRFEFVRSRPEGGACQLLEDRRCRAHTVRPGPCREFPLAGYLGTRLQAVVVLTCPGVDLSALDGYRGPDVASPSQGFDAELLALRDRITPESVGRRLAESGRRRSRIARSLSTEGRWVDEEEVRRQLRGALPLAFEEALPGEQPPPEEDGLELLPLVFDGRAGPVAMAGPPEGWELLELRAGGGVRTSLGAMPPLTQSPTVSPEAGRLLTGYLRYWLERDQLFGTVHLKMGREKRGDVSESVAAELRHIAATVVSRASLLAGLLRGNFGRLSGSDMIQGIRASDQDLLDRPTWGMRL